MRGLEKPGRDAFASDGRLDLMSFALVLATAGLVAWNALTFDTFDMRLGYDARDHELYAVTLAPGRLPDKDDTREFFSPPLPYVLPSLLIATGAGAGPCSAQASESAAAVRSARLTPAVRSRDHSSSPVHLRPGTSWSWGRQARRKMAPSRNCASSITSE